MRNLKARDPHSLAFDRGGTIFFTTQDSNLVGKLDPKTGKVALKEMPTAHARPYLIVQVARARSRVSTIKQEMAIAVNVATSKCSLPRMQ